MHTLSFGTALFSFGNLGGKEGKGHFSASRGVKPVALTFSSSAVCSLRLVLAVPGLPPTHSTPTAVSVRLDCLGRNGTLSLAMNFEHILIPSLLVLLDFSQIFPIFPLVAADSVMIGEKKEKVSCTVFLGKKFTIPREFRLQP